MANDNTSYAETRTRRYLRRTDEIRRPFLPYGLLPALGLGLVFLFGLTTCAKQNIEQTAERSAQAALNEIGADWASVDASGQWITLKGTPPSNSDAMAAMAAVRNVKADTTFGKLRPIERVRNGFADAGATTTRPALPAQPQTKHEFMFRTGNGVLRLEGSVPDASTKKTILDNAQIAIDPRQIQKIEDGLLVTNSSAEIGFMAVAVRGISTISRCTRGTATFVDKSFSLFCELPQRVAPAVEAEARAAMPLGTLGTVELLPTEAIASCENSLVDLFGSASIQFATASASINSSSYPLLDRIANAVATCPGTLRIGGHTDNVGSSNMNQDLSLRRADAVRLALAQRGVPSERLVTEGFGDRVPIAENTTALGRSRNRRIEIRVVRPTDSDPQ